MARYNIICFKNLELGSDHYRLLRDAAAKDNLNLLDSLLTDYRDTYTSDEVNVALTRAANNNSLDCVKRLLAHGADPNAADQDGYTCLMLAATNNFVEIAETMLEVGCDVNAVCDNSRTALHVATWGNHPKMLRLLLRTSVKCDTDIQDIEGDTPVMLAARRGYEYPIRLLIRAGCKLNIQSDEKDTALHYAAKRGHTKCVELLLKAGADKEAVDMWGYTPVLLAAHMRKLEPLKLLLKYGANVEVRDKPGRTTLHLAADKGFYEGVEELLNHGADPNVVDYEGITPLADAVFHRHNRTVILLLKAGACADITCKGIINHKVVVCSAFEVALTQNNLVLAYMLRSCGCQTYCSLLTSYYPEFLCQSETVVDWNLEFSNKPLRLGELSRLALRNEYGWRLPELIKVLQLPNIVKKLVTFSDFDEVLEAYEKEKLNAK